MRTIDRSSVFKRDYKREAKGRHRATLDAELMHILVALANDQPLALRTEEHSDIGLHRHTGNGQARSYLAI